MKNEKISTTTRAKITARKLITLRRKAILNRLLKKDYPYIHIEKIKIDFVNLPKEDGDEYEEEIKRLKLVYSEENKRLREHGNT